MHDVFVSHSHADNLLCDRYVEALKGYGLDVWYDRSALHAGRRLSTVIQRELQSRTAFIIMLTPSSNESYWVQLELGAFYDLAANDPRRLILPVRIAACEVPLLLRGITYVDAINMTFENAIKKMADALGLGSSLQEMPIQIQSKNVELGAVETVYRGHSLPVTKLAWSPDANHLASVSREKAVHIWDARTAAMRVVYKNHTGEVANTASWSADGTRIASGDSGGGVNIWSASTGGTRLVMNSHVGDPVYDITWSPDNSQVAIARASSIVQICDSQTGDIEFTYTEHAQGTRVLNGVLKVDWSPDGMFVASAGWDKKVRVWDISTGTTISVFSGHNDSTINGIAWSPEGMRIASVGSDGSLQIWNARSGHLISLYNVHPGQYEASICWSPDAVHLASVGFDSTIRLWDVTRNGQAEARSTDNGSMRAVAWSPSGQHLAVANGRSEVQIWSIVF